MNSDKEQQWEEIIDLLNQFIPNPIIRNTIISMIEKWGYNQVIDSKLWG